MYRCIYIYIYNIHVYVYVYIYIYTYTYADTCSLGGPGRPAGKYTTALCAIPIVISYHYLSFFFFLQGRTFSNPDPPAKGS